MKTDKDSTLKTRLTELQHREADHGDLPATNTEELQPGVVIEVAYAKLVFCPVKSPGRFAKNFSSNRLFFESQNALKLQLETERKR